MHLFTQDLEILAQRQGSHRWGMVHYFRLPSSLRDECRARKDAGCKDAEKYVDKANALSVALTGRAAGACGGGVVWGAVTCLSWLWKQICLSFFLEMRRCSCKQEWK